MVFILAMGTSAQDTRYPMNVADSAGREGTLAEPIERIIILNTDAAEAMSILNASEYIVGLTEGIKENWRFNWEFQKTRVPSIRRFLDGY